MSDFIPGFVANYPYTNFHEMNADYLLKRLHEVEEHIATLDGYIDGKIAEALQPYIAQLNSLTDELVSFESRINATINAQDAKINSEFIRISNELRREFAVSFAEIDAKLAEQDGKIDAAIADISRYMVDINNRLTARFDLFRDEINTLLAQFLADLPENIIVRSPFSGELVTVQEAINELYENTSRYRAITAAEFDAMGLTAAEYDALNISAWDYDTHGLDFLPVIDTLHNMFSPFTGLWSSLQTVINEIVNNIDRSHSITAGDFDGAELTVSEFEAYEMTAAVYDFSAADIIGA